MPLVRYYAHNLAQLPQPLKAIQIGPVWRAERPQQGRYRQFTQCDIDILGVASEVAEIELILATTEALAALGLKDLTVRINDRRLLGATVARTAGSTPSRAGSVFIALDKLDKIGREGVAAELREAGHAAGAVDRLLDLLASSCARRPCCARCWARGWTRACGAACSAFSTPSRPRRRAASGSRSTRRWCAGWATTPAPSSRSSTAEAPRRSRAVGATTGWSASSSGGTCPPPASRSASSAWSRSCSSAGRRPKWKRERVALVFDEAEATLGPVLALARDLREQGKHVLLEARAKRLGKQLQDLEIRGYRKIGVLGADGVVQWREPRAGGAGETSA